MYEYSVLSKKTPIVSVTKENDSIAKIPFMPEIYHKTFDLTEFIGESLARIRDVDSVHYFPISFEKLSDIRDGKVKLNKNTIRMGSYNFREKGKAYLTGATLSSVLKDKSFEELLNLCPDEKNRFDFLQENLEMFGLDTYMCQQDRPLNCYYVYDPVSDEYHLSPVFDYEDSLHRNLFNEWEYRTDFVMFESIDDYQKMMSEYPQFEEILKSYVDVDLVGTIRFMATNRGFTLKELDLDPYKRFEEYTHKRLEKILK